MMDCVEDALQFTNDVVRNCRTKGVRESNFVNFSEITDLPITTQQQFSLVMSSNALFLLSPLHTEFKSFVFSRHIEFDSNPFTKPHSFKRFFNVPFLHHVSK